MPRAVVRGVANSMNTRWAWLWLDYFPDAHLTGLSRAERETIAQLASTYYRLDRRTWVWLVPVVLAIAWAWLVAVLSLWNRFTRFQHVLMFAMFALSAYVAYALIKRAIFPTHLRRAAVELECADVCVECGYSFAGHGGSEGACPECGRPRHRFGNCR